MRLINKLFHGTFQSGLSMMVIAMAPGVFDGELFDDAEEICG